MQRAQAVRASTGYARVRRGEVAAPFYYRSDREPTSTEWEESLKHRGGKWYKFAFDEQGLWTPQQIFCFKAPPALLLWVINFVALLGHLGIAVTVVAEGSQHYDNLDFPLFNIEARWHNISADGFTYSVGRSEFGKLNLVVVCGLFSGLSALAHLAIVGTTWHPTLGMWYWRGLGRCCMWWRCARRPAGGRRVPDPGGARRRWLEYSLSAPLMAIALLLIGGVRDVTIMFLVFFGQMTCMTCGYVLERGAVPSYDTSNENKGWVLPFWARVLPFWTGCLAMFPAWTAFIYAFYSNISRQSERHNVEPPSWVYAIIWAQVCLFSAFTVPIIWYQNKPPSDYWKTELWYSILSLVAKLVLNGTLLSRVFLTGRLDLSSEDFTVREHGSG